MTRVCTICTHPQRREIDRLLVTRRDTYRDIARQFDVSKDALSRHRQDHLPELLLRAYEAEEASRADDLLADLRNARDRLSRLLRVSEHIVATAAKDKRDHVALDAIRTTTSVHREIRSYLELLAELEGELDRRAQVNVLVAPEWIAARGRIVAVLADYPDAQAAVVRALGDGA